jgi:hypothetical protein
MTLYFVFTIGAALFGLVVLMLDWLGRRGSRRKGAHR